MKIVLTVIDHEQNGFVALATWPAMADDVAREIIAGIDDEISDEMQPDINTDPFGFILDLMNENGDLLDTGARILPTQIAMRLAPDQVRRWLDERPDPDQVLNCAVPVLASTIRAVRPRETL